MLDSEPHRLVFATTGKDRQTIIDFSAHLSIHQGKPEWIEEYCSDMAAAFINGMAEAFPKAKHTVDKFHVMKLHGTIDVVTAAVINLSLRPQCLYE